MEGRRENNVCAQSKIFVWDKSQSGKLLSSLSLAPGTAEFDVLCGSSQQMMQDCVSSDALTVTATPDSSGHVQCGVCEVLLEGRQQQVKHYSTEYHRHNQTRALRGLASLTLQEFRSKASNAAGGGGGDDGGGRSSSFDTDAEDSSSDTDNEEEGEEEEMVDNEDHERSPSPPSPRVGRKPRLFFVNSQTNQVVSVYRALLLPSKVAPESASWLVSAAQLLPQCTKWSFLMQSGGHFAGAVFCGDRVVVHKTFHSYTVRAGQGGAQSSYDNRAGGSHPRSAGASLRRYNEAVHQQHIQEILESWRDHLAESDLVFVRVSKRSQALMFGAGRGSPFLCSRDPRMRSVPFPTRKPTFAEVKRVHRLLGEVKQHGTQEEFLAEMMADLPTDFRQQRSRNQVVDADEFSSSSSSCSSVDRDSQGRTWTTDTARIDESSVAVTNTLVGHVEATTMGGLESNIGQEEESSSRKKKKRKKTRREGGAGNAGISKNTQNSLEEHKNNTAMDCVRNLLYTACRCGDLPKLQALYRSSRGEEEEADLKQLSSGAQSVEQLRQQRSEQLQLLQMRLGGVLKTPLHVASEAGHREVVRWLLETGECDPSASDSRGRVPYSYCGSKVLKQVYREYRAQHPDQWNYEKSLIPAPLSEAQEIAIKEVKKAQKADKKARQKERRLKREELLAEQKERARYLSLSDREKRALAAERRLLAGDGRVAPVSLRCFQCANDMSGRVPFEYSDYKFCSTECVRLHRNSNRTTASRPL